MLNNMVKLSESSCRANELIKWGKLQKCIDGMNEWMDAMKMSDLIKAPPKKQAL